MVKRNRPVTIRFTDEELEKIDQACGDIARERWMRNWLLHTAIATCNDQQAQTVNVPAAQGSPPGRAAGTPPYRKGYGPDVSRVVGSGRAKQGVEPIPK